MTLFHLLALGAALALPRWALAASAPESCYQTGYLANGHTCGHGTNGPFESRVAEPYPLEQFVLLPDVDPTHTLYTLFLSEQSASNQWTVTYQPIAAGSYAFYMKFPGNNGTDEAPYALELQDGFGDAIPLRFEHGFPSCSESLTWIKVFDLSAVEYRVVIAGETGQSVKLAIEHLDAFAGSDLFVDADGDGHGNPGARLVSWCGAATGYASTADDCDDDDEMAHPGTAEVCNDKDDDCNGLVDDGVPACPDVGDAAPPQEQPAPGTSDGGAAMHEHPTTDGGATGLPSADAGSAPSVRPDTDAAVSQRPPGADAGTGGKPPSTAPTSDAGASASMGDASARDISDPQQRTSADCSCATVRSTPVKFEAVSLFLLASLACWRRRTPRVESTLG